MLSGQHDWTMNPSINRTRCVIGPFFLSARPVGVPDAQILKRRRDEGERGRGEQRQNG